jgi:hypothetical protein
MRSVFASSLGGLAALLFSVALFTEATAQDKQEAVRVTIKSVRVKAVNKDGNAWDVNNGKPDLAVRIRNMSDKNVKDLTTDTAEDSFQATFTGAIVPALRDQMLQIDVVDKDVAIEDLIGRKTLVLNQDTLKNGRVELSFDQVESLVLEFAK